MRGRIASRIMLTTLLFTMLIVAFNMVPISAEGPFIRDLTVLISPESPIEEYDKVNVTVNFWILEAQHGVDFGNLTQVDNVFFVEINVSMIGLEIIGPWVYNHTYQMGKMLQGSYNFSAYVYLSEIRILLASTTKLFTVTSVIKVPDNYLTIQEAINNASNEDTIYVRAGEYYETIVVNKTVSLIGESRDTTIIDGGDAEESIAVEVSAKNVVFKGFSTRASGFYSIHIFLHESADCLITDNKIVGLKILMIPVRGIYISSSTNITVRSNYVDGVTGPGAYLYNSSALVTENDITKGWYGMKLEESHNSKIFHNNFINNREHVLSVNSTNSWDNGYPSGGNYWSSGWNWTFNPLDENKDKMGDIPYRIDENNTDRFPLIYQYGYKPKPDVNDDGIISIEDLYKIAQAYGSRPGDNRWNPIADINAQTTIELDEIINIKDIYQIARNFGREWKDP